LAHTIAVIDDANVELPTDMISYTARTIVDEIKDLQVLVNAWSDAQDKPKPSPRKVSGC